MEKRMEEIKGVIARYRLVADRKNELILRGYTVEERSMGSGGVGQVRTVAGETRIQIGYGHGRHNYASCVIIK